MEEIKPNGICWKFVNYRQNNTRVFACNAIMFFNREDATQDVIINDTFRLKPGQAIEFGCNQNEVDLTVYKMDFPVPGGIINIAYKVDQGITLPELKRHVDLARLAPIKPYSRRNPGTQVTRRESNVNRRYKRILTDF